MKKQLVVLLMLFIGVAIDARGQSFEVMLGEKRLFVDAQYLKFFDTRNRVSLFSRSRATAEYDTQRTNLFTGAYLNYTTPVGVGGTVLGRIGTFGSGVDVGVHYFRASKRFLIYALPSINLSNSLAYSWFSIVRFTPTLTKFWSGYSSLELFSAFNRLGHANSVQRLRMGLDNRGYQFGIALNLGQQNKEWKHSNTNFGIFFRKQF